VLSIHYPAFLSLDPAAPIFSLVAEPNHETAALNLPLGYSFGLSFLDSSFYSS